MRYFIHHIDEYLIISIFNLIFLIMNLNRVCYFLSSFFQLSLSYFHPFHLVKKGIKRVSEGIRFMRNGKGLKL